MENEEVAKRKEREKILTLPCSYVNFTAQQKQQKIIHNIVGIYQLGMFSSAETKDWRSHMDVHPLSPSSSLLPIGGSGAVY